MGKYIKHYCRKQKYGSNGWAFDCDANGVITDPKMLDGYHDMIANCEAYIDKHKLSIGVSDMFDVWGEILDIDKGGAVNQDMTLDEAIQHLCEILSDEDMDWACEECKAEHQQLLKWLLELREVKGKSFKKSGRYIDIEELRDAITNECTDVCQDCGDYAEFGYSLHNLYGIINGLTIVDDVRAIVTCKECAWGHDEIVGGYPCTRCSNDRTALFDTVNDRDFYCFFGQAKEERQHE